MTAGMTPSNPAYDSARVLSLRPVELGCLSCVAAAFPAAGIELFN
jgi:hypothetical protein